MYRYLWFPAPQVYHASVFRNQLSVVMLFQVSQPLWVPCFDKAAAHYVQHQALKEKSVGSNYTMTIWYHLHHQTGNKASSWKFCYSLLWGLCHTIQLSKSHNAKTEIWYIVQQFLLWIKSLRKSECWKLTISCIEMFGYTCSNNLRYLRQRLSLHLYPLAHHARAYPSFQSMEQLRFLLHLSSYPSPSPDRMLICCRVTSPQHQICL